MPDQLPTAPQNFNEVERYVSYLPLERVEKLNKEARRVLDWYDESAALYKDREAKLIVKLAGYIIELTQPNK